MDVSGLHVIHDLVITTDEIEAMRFWVADSAPANPHGEDLAALTLADVVAGVRDYYQGGVSAFLAELHAGLEV